MMRKWEALVRGLQILAEANDGDISVDAHIDVLYSGGCVSLSHTDGVKLREMGWGWSEEYGWEIEV